MTCREIEAELVAYHFGSLEGEARDAVEAHLAGCAGCVRAFIAVKREIETAESGPRPSTQARARLGQAVAAELHRPAHPRPRWQRPFAFGFASAAIVAATLAMRLLTSAAAMPYGLSFEPRGRPAPAPPPATAKPPAQ